MVGTVGGILGDAGVNIAGMQVARDAKGGQRAGRALGRLARSPPTRWSRSRPRSTPAFVRAVNLV